MTDAPSPTEAPRDVLPRIAVTVVTWNSAEVITGLIESLPDGMAGTDWTLVVADNDSADNTVDLIRKLAPDAVVVQTGRNAGYSAGINAALAAAPAHDAVLVCNPDIRMRPGCAAALMAGLGRPGTGITVPLLYKGDGSLILSLRREPTVLRALGEAVLGNRRAGRFPALSETVSTAAPYRTTTTSDWAAGSLMLVSAACSAACGPWDESYFLYSEETEYALRARDHGFATRLIPDAVAVHLEGDSAVSPRLWSLLTVNRVRLFHRRHRSRIRTGAFFSAVLLRELSRAALGRPQNRAAVAALLSPHRLRTRPGPSWGT